MSASRHASTPSSHASLAPLWQLFKGSAIAALVGLLVGVLLCALFAAYLSSTTDPDAHLAPLALAAFTLSALTCGLVAHKLTRRPPLPCALVGGALLLLTFGALALRLPNAAEQTWQPSVRWMLTLGVPVFAALGAKLAAYAPQKRKKRRRK